MKSFLLLFLLGTVNLSSQEVISNFLRSTSWKTSINNPSKPEEITDENGIVFIKIPAGKFRMGCTEGDTSCSSNEKPRHLVEIPNPFWMGKFEVTQGQWKKIMGKNPSYFQQCGENCPVEYVSWYDVQEFIKKINEASKGKRKYRLPTEAEWEYAARGGSSSLADKYPWGNEMSEDYAWYSSNSGSKTHPVGEKKPNSFGLYDISGNVWEWVEDTYLKDLYQKRKEHGIFYKGELGHNKVSRGGSYLSHANALRASYRVINFPASSNDILGFRLSASVAE